MITTLLSASAAVALLASANPNLVSMDTPPSMTVSTADLNLDTVQGRARLDSRLHHAVALVCGDADNRDLSQMMAVHACRRTADERVRTQVLAMRAQPEQLAAATIRR